MSAIHTTIQKKTGSWRRFAGHSVLSLVVVLLSTLLYSCTNEESDGNVPSPQQQVEEDNEVILSLRLPGSSPATRLTNTEENTVSEVDVLVFNEDGNYLYSRQAYSVRVDDDTYDFAVRLLMTEEGETVDLWVFANAHEILTHTPAAGTTKADVAAALLAGETTYNVTQIPPIVGDPVLIPMWGTIDAVSIPITGGRNKVDLTRMVAKIDVAVKSTIDEDKFKLTNVYFYNRNSQGCVVPGTIADSEWSAPTATSLSLPADPVKKTGEAYAYTTVTDNAIKNTIYAFEADGGTGYTGQTYTTDPCLIIGGTYKGGAETYYRVNFAKIKDNEEIYLDILRNHHYDIEIQDVTGAGFNTQAEALQSLPVNMIAQVVEWDEMGMTDITFDGQYELAVDRDSVTFVKSGNAQTVYVRTSWVEGWSVDTQAGNLPSWLHITSPTPANFIATGEKDKTIPLVITADELPTSISREGGFWITAGRMKKYIKVVQPMFNLWYKTNSASIADGNTVPRLASNFTIDFDGTYEGVIYVYTYTKTAGIDLLVGIYSTAKKTGHSVAIPVNNTWYDRDLYYTFAGVGIPEQKIDGLTHTQPGYSIPTVEGDDTYDPGHPYTFKLPGGDYPVGTILCFMDGNNTEVCFTEIISITDEYEITIPNGTSQELKLYVKVDMDEYIFLGKTLERVYTFRASEDDVYGQYAFYRLILDKPIHEYSYITSEDLTIPAGWEFAQAGVVSSDRVMRYCSQTAKYMDGTDMIYNAEFVLGDGDMWYIWLDASEIYITVQNGKAYYEIYEVRYFYRNQDTVWYSYMEATWPCYETRKTINVLLKKTDTGN
jgi:hypothetical protein